ncbi:hypothetical protein SXANM310S_03856 [Streptomyces xanthochromogenes]
MSSAGGLSSGGSHTWCAAGPRASRRRTITSSTVSASASSVRGPLLGRGPGTVCGAYVTGTSAAVNRTGLRSTGTGPPSAAERSAPVRYTPDTYAALKRVISSVPNFR